MQTLHFVSAHSRVEAINGRRASFMTAGKITQNLELNRFEDRKFSTSIMGSASLPLTFSER